MKREHSSTGNISNSTQQTDGLVGCYHYKDIDFNLGDISLVLYILNLVVNCVSALATVVINSLVLLTIRRTVTLHSPSNTLLFGLAMSDFGVGVIVQPLFFAHILGKLIRNKDCFCNTGIAIEVCANSLCIISLLTVTAVSIDRYLALKLHLRYKEIITIQRVTVVIGIIWLFGSIIGSMWLYKPYWVKYSVSSTISVCLVAAVFSYMQIYCVVRRHYKNDMALRSVNEADRIEHSVNMLKFKSHALGTFWVYCFIILCYFPYFCVVMVIAVTGLSTIKRFFYEITALFVFMNSFLNPVVYCWRLKDVRHAVRNTAKRFWRAFVKSQHSTEQ
ncbi:adenosine receptor A3-like [Montipora capricornis]|uniref:adenosine receptor A3-like n=1 Tax=Montipora capricornis TaxID=246305 RepID=UPI0035F20747